MSDIPPETSGTDANAGVTYRFWTFADLMTELEAVPV
jgi:hypothetical protein